MNIEVLSALGPTAVVAVVSLGLFWRVYKVLSNEVMHELRAQTKALTALAKAVNKLSRGGKK